MTYNIISTGSKGNAVVLNGEILIDCGVPFKMLQEVKRQLRLVLLTHIHSDHFNPATVRALTEERPTLRWGCCHWMVQPLLDAGVSATKIDVFELNHSYFYGGLCSLKPVPLVHDVPNCGWDLMVVDKLFPIEEAKSSTVFYATDTGTLDGISCPGYDLYLVEANHKREEILQKIHDKEKAGEYAYEKRAAATHLSEEQTIDWLAKNMEQNSQYVFLHQHEEKGK